MARFIKLTKDIIETCKSEFDQVLEKAHNEFNSNLDSQKCMNGKIEYVFAKYVKDLSFCAGKRRATIHFSELAWYKMFLLIHEYSSEVAWHGVAYRDEDETKDDYYITDIIVYPQEVDGTNVNTDQQKYEEWLFNLPDDVFNNLRMQGHSHVNMGVTPSATDIDYQRNMLNMMNGDMFYIFMIYNKSLTRNISIYDLKKNILFEPTDVDVVIQNDELGLENILSDSLKLVEKKKYTYGSQYYQGNNTFSTAVTAVPVKKEETPVNSENDKPAKKEKKKKSFKELNAPKASCSYSYYDDCDVYGYDDSDDYYRRYGAQALDPFYSYTGYSSK